LNDSETAALIERVTKVINPKEIHTYEKYKRDEVLKFFRIRGLSIRQNVRLLGVSFGVIRGI
jgi:putative transposase